MEQQNYYNNHSGRYDYANGKGPAERIPPEKGSESMVQAYPRSYTPQTFTTDRGGPTPTSSHESSLKTRRRAQLIAARRRRSKRRWFICGAIMAAIVAAAVGLGVGLTFYQKKLSQAQSGIITGFYQPPAQSHTTPQNELLVQMFEANIPKNASFWNTLEAELENLHVLGVSQIWIPPAMKGAIQAQLNYDVYDHWDLGEFNQQGNVSTNMGTKSQLTSLIHAANATNIQVIWDAVFNQKSGGETKITCPAYTVNATDRLQVTSTNFNLQAYISFEFPGRNGKYSAKTWGCDDFTGVDYDAGTGTSGVFKIDGGSINAFETDVSHENGNYDFLQLSDIAYNNPSVRADMLAWIKWVNDQFPNLGFRIDAAKHTSAGFILDVINELKADNGGRLPFVAGEYLDDDIVAMGAYLDTLQNQASLFDSALLTNFNGYSTGVLTDLTQMYNYTIIANRSSQAVTYVATHDTQPGQATFNLWVTGWFVPLAYSVTLLRQQGHPCIFFGNLYGLYDNFTTSYTPDPYNSLIADLAVARKYWMYGTQTDYFDSPSCIGWTLTGTSDRPDGLAVIMSNAFTATTKTMNVGQQHAGEVWFDITQNIITQTVTIGSGGNAVFPVRGQSVSVWVNKNAQEGLTSLGKFDTDIYNLSPFYIGEASNNYVGVGGGTQEALQLS